MGYDFIDFTLDERLRDFDAVIVESTSVTPVYWEKQAGIRQLIPTMVLKRLREGSPVTPLVSYAMVQTNITADWIASQNVISSPQLLTRLLRERKQFSERASACDQLPGASDAIDATLALYDHVSQAQVRAANAIELLRGSIGEHQNVGMRTSDKPWLKKNTCQPPSESERAALALAFHQASCGYNTLLLARSHSVAQLANSFRSLTRYRAPLVIAPSIFANINQSHFVALEPNHNYSRVRSE